MERSIQWVAGLLEGEGYFITRRKRAGYGVGHGMSAYIAVTMTDLDVIEEYAATLRKLLGIEACITSVKVREGHKPSWRARVEKKEDVSRLAVAILPYMAERRSLAILNILEWNQLRNELPHGNTGRKRLAGV